MGGVSVKIIGMPETLHALEAIEEATRGAKLAAVAVVGAMPIQNAWKQKAPIKTGTYRRSIHTETEAVNERAATVVIGTDITDPPYPIFLEYGTAHMAARPSAQPAFDEQVDKAISEAEAALRTILEGVGR
jgi:HK97 gp10 family phage protein